MSEIQQPPVQVLIVEDEPLVRMVARDIFEEAGFEPIEAANADEAMRLLSCANRFAAVVSDIEMPGDMSGLDLAWAVRTHWPRIAVILTSGRQLPRPSELPRKVRFIAKPYHPAHLVQLVTEAVS
jgi:two-component system, response regulator PdtaR